VGRAAAGAARAAGHAVTAFSRSAGQDVLDRGAVRAALTGSDAVLVTLGVSPRERTTTPEDICSRGTQIILTEMKRAAVDRIVAVTSYGVGETKPLTPFPFNVVAKTLLRGIMADKELQERMIRASGTQWTIVQPLGLTDGPESGEPYVSTDGSRTSTRVSRADVAAICLKAIAHSMFIEKSIAVSAR
jgi:uncharacterized protein YbjT (DUF2867 family)